MTDIQNLENLTERINCIIPWMQPVFKKLIQNGNHIIFWTSATAEHLKKMKKAMSLELASLPAISREDFRSVSLAF